VVQDYRDMSGRVDKVIGKSEFFSNLEDFLITCYIVKVSSPLLDSPPLNQQGRALLFILKFALLSFLKDLCNFQSFHFVQESASTVGP